MAAADPRQSTVIFLHIPKTAGTTMHSIFEKLYPPGALYSTYPANHPHGSLEAYEAFPPERKAQIRVLLGHFSYGVHDLVPGQVDTNGKNDALPYEAPPEGLFPDVRT